MLKESNLNCYELKGIFPVVTMPLTESIVEVWDCSEIPISDIDETMFPECIEFFNKPETLAIPNHVYTKHLFDLKHKGQGVNFHFCKFIPFEEKIEGFTKYFMQVIIIDKVYADQKSRPDEKVAAGSIRYIYELTTEQAKKLVVCRNYHDSCMVIRKLTGWGDLKSSNNPAIITGAQ